MFKPQQQDKEVKINQVNGLLDKGCSFEGKLTFDGSIQINGNFKGEIFSDGTLVIGNDAHVEANIHVDTLVAYGSVQGIVEAKSRIEMHVPATVIADIRTKTLSIEDGVVFQGKCQMDRTEAEKSEATKRNFKEGEESDENVFVM